MREEHSPGVWGAEPRLSPQNSTLTIEEFHAKLQEATNFPLRPFVIPFLKVGLQPGQGGIHGTISAQGIWGWLWGWQLPVGLHVCPHTCGVTQGQGWLQ